VLAVLAEPLAADAELDAELALDAALVAEVLALLAWVLAVLAELAALVADVDALLALVDAAEADAAALVAEVVADALSTIRSHLALSALVLIGCEPEDVWLVFA